MAVTRIDRVERNRIDDTYEAECVAAHGDNRGYGGVVRLMLDWSVQGCGSNAPLGDGNTQETRRRMAVAT